MTSKVRVIPDSPPSDNCIIVHQHEGPGNVWVAETTINGISYQAKSYGSPVQALAKALVEAGIGNYPMRVTTKGLRGYMEYSSLHHTIKRLK